MFFFCGWRADDGIPLAIDSDAERLRRTRDTGERTVAAYVVYSAASPSTCSSLRIAGAKGFASKVSSHAEATAWTRHAEQGKGDVSRDAPGTGPACRISRGHNVSSRIAFVD